MSKTNYIFYALIILILCSCSMTKGLKEGEQLHSTTNFIFENPKEINNKKRLETNLALIAKPNPAAGVEKWQVGIYNSINKKEKKKGLGRWIQKKIGKPPVLYDEAKVERSRLVMEKYLHDNGYFGSTIDMDTTVKDKKVSVEYSITSKGQYFVRNIFQPADTLPLTHLLKAYENKTLLKKEKPYDLSVLSAERTRLSDLANNNGFYEITKDNFFYFVDSTAGDLQVDIYLRLKQTGDSSIYQVYYIDDSWVFPDYTLQGKGESESTLDTFRFRRLNIVQEQTVLRPTVMSRMIWQDSTSLFSKEEQQNTINRLLNLGIYKFANIRFDKQVRQDTHFLDRYVYLTPGLMRDLGTEFQVNSRSGNFLGTEISGNFSHKNAFKGAELFNLNLTTGVETYIGANAGSSINTINASLNASLQLPGTYAPFVDRRQVRGEVLPRTAFTIGDDFQQRSGFYTVNSFNLSLGYNWKRTRWTHEFKPLFMNFINLLESSDELDELLSQNRRLRASFENVLVLGTNYTFSRSTQTANKKGSYFYYRGTLETAGNLLNLVASDPGPGLPGEFLGIPFSQYVKVENDYRHYFPLRKGMLAGRFFTGVAFPYGNAEVIPYIKQYFIGGASSIRAFRIRTLGPGSYESKIDDDDSNFVDQTGDLKLELNLEYRFPLFTYLKGALFVDAGNIWLVKGDADESTPEKDGLFEFNRFYQEIAIGTGFGLRIDFDVAVIRSDWAFAIRRPTQTEGSQWLFSEIDLLSNSWRKESLVWNIAIGYPF